MRQESAGDTAKTLERSLKIGEDRLARDIGARHHEHLEIVIEEQVMKRRVREHHAEIAVVRRNVRCERARCVLPPPEKHDRAPRAGQRLLLDRIDLHELARHVERPAHDGERFRGTVLLLTERADGTANRSTRRDVKSPESANADDTAVVQKPSRPYCLVRGYDVVRHPQVAPAEQELTRSRRRIARRDQLERRAADRTRVRLRVKSTIEWILVLAQALRAHREQLHRGLRAIVRRLLYDREARPAVRAVDERVVVPAVALVEKLSMAVGADGDIRTDECHLVTVRLALADFEPREPPDLELVPLDGVDARKRWRLFIERPLERAELINGTFALDDDAAARVDDPAVELQFVRDTVDERPESHALDDAAHGESRRVPSGLRDRGTLLW